MQKLTERASWKALEAHFEKIKDVHMRDLFAQDKQRFKKFSTQMDDILLDFSKNRIDDETFTLLCDLAKDIGIEEWRDQMFSGAPLNNSEFRPVLHTALRNRNNTPVFVDGEDVMPKINRVLAQIRYFTERVPPCLLSPQMKKRLMAHMTTICPKRQIAAVHANISLSQHDD